MHFAAIEKLLLSTKRSIGTLMDKMQPVVSENKRFDYQETAKNFSFFWPFRSVRFLMQKKFLRTKFLIDSLQIHKF